MKSILSLGVLLLVGLSTTGHGADLSDDDLAGLGREFALAINQRQADALDALISNGHLADRVAELAVDQPKDKAGFVRGFQQGIATLSQRMVDEMQRQNGVAVFLRVHDFNGMHGPLVRYDMEGGYNYVLLVPVQVAGAARIGDLYFATSGQLFSETTAVAAKLLLAPNDSFLGKLFGGIEVDADLLADFQEIGRMHQEGDYAGGYQKLLELPEGIRNQFVINNYAVQFAARISEDLYRRELRRLARYHKDDPSAAFMLIDHYFYEEDYDSAMAVIDVMEKAYGADAVMFLFRANVELARGDLPKARQFARKATQLEPDHEDSQWTLLTALMQSDDYEAGIAVLDVLERDFGYSFAAENFESAPLYGGFIQSKAFSDWIGGKQ